ncbi:MAG: uracil-DNA glycosylase [Parachlamydiaceae bacterium]|nr:uracil-DNA glycosylase [Parachlamydiaceae bacterium]
MSQPKKSFFREGSDWNDVLQDQVSLPYVAALSEFVQKERALGIPIYPSRENVFEAFNKTSFADVKVVIMGQDPYHGPNQAHGLSFSVLPGIPHPPSLRNIFKELKEDLNLPIPRHGCLTGWAEQGVLLLNATLTVQQGEPMSHHGQGWELFTDAVMTKLSQRLDPVIFVLWGASAQKKCKNLNLAERHHVLIAPHPSPFSAHNGFFGSRPFSKINHLLKKIGKSEINWEI